MYWFQFLSENSKAPFEVSRNIVNPYTAKFVYYCLIILCAMCDISELLYATVIWPFDIDISHSNMIYWRHMSWLTP